MKKSAKKPSRRRGRKKKTSKSKVDNKISFKAFFARCVNLGLIEAWKEPEVYTFFKNRDLKDKEDLDTYQKMLQNY